MPGRKMKPFQTSWGEIIPGLARDVDGRWRIAATGKRFSEADERKAIERFRAQQPERGSVFIPVAHGTAAENAETADKLAQEIDGPLTMMVEEGSEWEQDDVRHWIGHQVDETALWNYVRHMIETNPQHVFNMTGALLTSTRPIAPTEIKLKTLLDIYQQHADVKPDSKREAGNTFRTFMRITGAKTLADLTVPTLVKYRDTMKAGKKTPGTIGAYFGRVKWIIDFAKTEGQDASQIDAALSRLAILKAPKDRRTHQPTPITPEAFHAIYAVSGTMAPDWQPRMLLMLNLCLHFDECLDLEWTDFDLEAGTFCTRRNKRGRVVRAATLWPETLTALRTMIQTRTGSPYVFTSTHGTRYNAKGQWKTWEKLRRAAKWPSVQMDDIRDGAYTAAANRCEERLARLLAGHRSHGLQDNYVQRNPSMVRPACEAVRVAYYEPAAVTTPTAAAPAA